MNIIMKSLSILKEQRGNFTIESTLIFPILFMITLSTLFSSLFYYQKVILYSSSSLTAERTSFTWDNSFKDPITGRVSSEVGDELYWRAFQDSISQIFLLGADDGKVILELPVQNNMNGYSGVLKKMHNAAQLLPDSFIGKIAYSNHLVSRKVTVELNRFIQIPEIMKMNNHVYSYVESSITEPVEFIRNIDLLRTYVQELKQRKISEGKVRDAFDQFFDFESPTSFANHGDAAIYLEKLVQGSKNKFDTSFGKRKIDALDRNGVAHQAYLTFNENQLRSQMVKDVELLNHGEDVKGVIWHFFRKHNQTIRVGPSKAFISELESKGIVVIIHD
ncbi:TadE/TadG family type IV pilus assembly protein [Chengkuizengella sediminis]|uniref:TadE/TadG family type IV pilus assembly protein n=1 Tax=Chengkuizengella sediminis TaxID=1885917 RepID=UPI00138A4ECE|nr:hypothetical protein [Chengkuizengella sediminis]NDI35579.1 hypothetical protein [Chengkuizengella sediminis]